MTSAGKPRQPLKIPPAEAGIWTAKAMRATILGGYEHTLLRCRQANFILSLPRHKYYGRALLRRRQGNMICAA